MARPPTVVVPVMFALPVIERLEDPVMYPVESPASVEVPVTSSVFVTRVPPSTLSVPVIPVFPATLKSVYGEVVAIPSLPTFEPLMVERVKSGVFVVEVAKLKTLIVFEGSVEVADFAYEKVRLAAELEEYVMTLESRYAGTTHAHVRKTIVI